MSRKKKDYEAYMMSDGLSEKEKEQLKALMEKQKKADDQDAAFRADVLKHREKVIRILGLDPDSAKSVPKELCEEEKKKIRIADAALEWGNVAGYSADQLPGIFQRMAADAKAKRQQQDQTGNRYQQ